MSIFITKGNSFSAEYTSAYYTTLTDDWEGSVELYDTYPGTPITTKNLTRVGDKFTLNLTAGEIIALNAYSYYLVATITNTVLAVSITSIDVITIIDMSVLNSATCVVCGTIEKIDDTSVGIITLRPGVSRWKGTIVTAKPLVATELSGNIIGIDSVVTKTDAAGYFQFTLLPGLEVVLTCPSFDKSVTITTVANTVIDVSTYF